MKNLPKIGDTVQYYDSGKRIVGFVYSKDAIYCNLRRKVQLWGGPIYTGDGYLVGRTVLVEKHLEFFR